jgi:hypothetical protein
MLENALMLADVGAAIPSIDPTGGFFELFLRNGLLGAAVALLSWLLIKRDNDLQKSQEGRLEDAKSLSEAVKSHTVALQASNSANDERNRALEVASRASERSAIVIEQMAKEITIMRSIITDLKEQLRAK